MCWPRQRLKGFSCSAPVSAEAEELRLDLPEMGSLAYPAATDIATAVILRGGRGAPVSGIGPSLMERES